MPNAQHPTPNAQRLTPNAYFIGAGGIGMAALERYFLSKGCKVAGYDRTPSELTAALSSEGVEIVYDDDPALIPEAFRDPQTTLVVYTPAVPAEHRGLQWFRANGFEVVKRAAVLGRVTRSEKALCFAGTHGKTTTSSMAAHILKESGRGANAFLGGVLRNYGTNFLLDSRSPYAVIEADEYDRSFHQLSPYVAVITSTDPDHLDIYGTEEAYLESFAHFTELIQPGGALLVHTGLKLRPRVGSEVKTYTYSASEGDFHAANIRIGDGTIRFDLVTPTETIADIELGVPVEVNIDNAIAACGGVWLLHDPAVIADDYRRAMKTFMGAKRRFEFWLRTPDRVIIDDYAHHPDELRASLRSVRRLFPGKRLVVAFQPHLYSRTRDFASQFARALSQADEVLLLPIYPARELPIEGVNSELIFRDITAPEKRIVEKTELVDAVKQSNFDVLLTVGAGDINLLLPEIVDACK
ncbi:MAG: UDP-N-acetylmuramate--L-alanine ligase [Bacteroides sp.]|nr:UDP-N-acetylmuramate--L-alanine ligase [Bacteroides sp.]MCM1379214.1 UDP-N-acetylmuramate--L-alanine ligase [Bacteroides sp.]MCM1445137.1 UDP-N-acetylmuramate--L-alanine ligase [Prevotella sp.]